MSTAVKWKRKASLLLVKGAQALDLSAFHFTFHTDQADVPSPNSCTIRVFNLKPETIAQIRGEFSDVVVQAGYENDSFGVVFQGNIRQYRIGKDNAVDSYLDILAADGDFAYNNTVVSKSIAANSTYQQRIAAIQGAFAANGLNAGFDGVKPVGGILPRGKVLFGLARAAMNVEMKTQGATWSIQDGKINKIPLDSYMPDEVVVLTSKTGLIGRPEATEEGVRARMLINPRVIPGSLVQIDNASINQTVASSSNPANVPFNQWQGVQLIADVSTDGLYRVFVAEHSGDTRGQEWYTDIVCLAVNRSTRKVKRYG